MPRYASETTVPVERSRAEIEGILVRYGANKFTTGWQEGQAMVAFQIRDLFIRFVLPIPARTEDRFWKKKDRHGYIQKRTEGQAESAYQQEVRQRWRALALTIKAKLEAVECAISTIEKEFLAFIVMPNNWSVGDWIVEHGLEQIKAGEMPLLLPPPTKVQHEEETE